MIAQHQKLESRGKQGSTTKQDPSFSESGASPYAFKLAAVKSYSSFNVNYSSNLTDLQVAARLLGHKANAFLTSKAKCRKTTRKRHNCAKPHERRATAQLTLAFSQPIQFTSRHDDTFNDLLIDSK